MDVGNSVRKAILDWEQHEPDAAMLHACNAVDGTAKKLYAGLGNKARFTHLLRENYAILGPMGIPGIDLKAESFSVNTKDPSLPGGRADAADVIYGIHRCCHGHGDELPDGFQLFPDAAGPPQFTRIQFDQETV